MKLLDKLKNALFEEEEDEQEEEIVKQVDVKKTIENKPEEKPVRKSRTEEKNYEEIVEEPVAAEEEFVSAFDFSKEVPKKSPVIFDEEDFISDTREYDFNKVPKREEKILYRGHEIKEEKTKDKFKPSPIISPVYGILDESEIQKKDIDISEFTTTHSYVEKKKESVLDFDTVRQKAFGEVKEEPEEDLLCDMTSEENKPEINKITLGDAEEYFNDLGLEYNVDYKDKEKTVKKEMTREQKNAEEKDTEAEEKNLYDLIDLMYDRKED